MDARAPAVVAVVVAKDPGEWFEESLRSLAAQDYQELSILVVVPAGAADPSSRVAAVLPDALVSPVGAPTYAGALCEALASVEGAAFFLLCHDDVALSPSALRALIQESFRSNAGVVSPKVTRWDDPRALVHVGQNADKTGAVVERVQDGEVDHGQHDAVREVFVAPGGCTLVRADLWHELGGFDPALVAMGEDLDFCWRAQIAGARVVVAPQVKVRHREATVHQERTVPPDDHGLRRSAEALERRHELRAVLKCYSLFHLLRVLPQVVLLSVGEVLAALAAANTERAGWVLSAWGWNLARLGELHRLRRQVRHHRVVPDRQVRRLQAKGSSRLSASLTEAAQQGRELFMSKAAKEAVAASDEPELTGSVGGAFSEDSSFDELDDTTRVRRPPPLSTPRSRFFVWVAAAAVLLVGSRQILSGGFPGVGQLLAFPSWSGAWHQFFASWQPAGLGTTAPATPAFGVLGALGTVLFGNMGLTQTVAVLGCLPLGCLGVVRLLRPWCSARARVVAGLAYLGLPLAYDALAQGRWDTLVAYASVPWILSRLLRAGGGAPYAPRAGWRGSLGGQALSLGVVVALAVSFAPAVAVDVVLVALAVPLGSALVGLGGGQALRSALRGVAVGLGAVAVAAVLCLPWTIGVLSAGRGAVAILGLPSAAQHGPSWSALLRFDLGPVGGSFVSWLLLAAAVLPLVVGRGLRLALAARLWCVGLSSFLLALVVARGWTGSFAPGLGVLLAPAACAVGASVGLGLAAFEHDLVRYRFGWRQVVSVTALAAAAVGVTPVLAEAQHGQWGLPATGISQPLGFLGRGQPGGARVLWLADPRALPGGGWSLGQGLAYATTEGGAPGAANLFAPAGPGPAGMLARAVGLAQTGRTTELGSLLAPAGVRYLVVMETLAPSVAGVEEAAAFPTPPSLLQGLLSQNDLRLLPGGEGFSVFVNTAALPERAARRGAAALPTAARWATPGDLAGWRPVLAGSPGATSYRGPVPAGSVLSSYAPAGRWGLQVGGRQVPGRPALGFATQFRAPGGAAVLSFAGAPWVPLGVGAEVVGWLVLLGLLVAGIPRRHERRSHRAVDGVSAPDAAGTPAARHEVTV
jgi:GT2 family glycosyltransferase